MDRKTAIGGTLFCAVLAAGPVQAGEGQTQQELEAQGLGQSRGNPIPMPAGTPRLNADNDPVTGGSYAGVVFVNFDGATLTGGSDDSRNNVTGISQLAGPFAAYGEGAKRDATLQAVREDWSAYNILIVDERPAQGDYTMNMTGPTNPFPGNILGVALLDCDDASTHNNVTYAFHSANDSHSAATQATTVSQEVAHSYGLEHVNDGSDIMNPSNVGGDPSFRDECINIVPDPDFGILCTGQHTAACGSGLQQNSHLELLNIFGPAIVDDAPPEVELVSPMDGANFQVGDSFSIDVEAFDNGSVAQVELFVDGVAEGTRTSAPWSFDVDDVPLGEYEFYVSAVDVAGNEAMSNVVTISVTATGEAPDGGDTTGATGDGTGGSGDPTGDSDTTDDSDTGDDSTDGALPPAFGGATEDSDGCACNSGGAPTGFTATLLLLGFASTRRRRVAL